MFVSPSKLKEQNFSCAIFYQPINLKSVFTYLKVVVKWLATLVWIYFGGRDTKNTEKRFVLNDNIPVLQTIAGSLRPRFVPSAGKSRSQWVSGRHIKSPAHPSGSDTWITVVDLTGIPPYLSYHSHEFIDVCVCVGKTLFGNVTSWFSAPPFRSILSNSHWRANARGYYDR